MVAFCRLVNIGRITSVKLLHVCIDVFASYLNTVRTDLHYIALYCMTMHNHTSYMPLFFLGVERSLCLADDLFLLRRGLIKYVSPQAASYRTILRVSVGTPHHWKVLLIFAAAGANRIRTQEEPRP